MLVVAAYEIGFMDWVHHSLGPTYHIVADVLVFGTVGPVLAFFLIDLFGRWLEERDTSDLQAQILNQAREDAAESRRLCDEALQVLFSTGALVALVKSHEADLPPETAAQIEAMEVALNQSIDELRSRLLKPEHFS